MEVLRQGRRPAASGLDPGSGKDKMLLFVWLTTGLLTLPLGIG